MGSRDGLGRPPASASRAPVELDSEAVGFGPEVWAELPGWEGEHRCALIAVDGDLRAETSAVFVTTASGLPPRRFAGG